MKVYYKALLDSRGDSYYVVDTSQFRVDATCKELIDTEKILKLRGELK